MTTQSENVRVKSERLLKEGALDPMPAEARVFRVTGDHGIYLTFVSASVQYCTCPATSECSHLLAAVQWVLAEGDRAMEKGSERIERYEAARSARQAKDREAADDLFRRLGA